MGQDALNFAQVKARIKPFADNVKLKSVCFTLSYNFM